jgi:hypothetical protein
MVVEGLFEFGVMDHDLLTAASGSPTVGVRVSHLSRLTIVRAASSPFGFIDLS